MSSRRRRGLGSGTLKRDLVAFWNLEEASGTRIDATGRGNNLTDNNTVTQAAGRIGSAAQFTSANSEWLEIADNADLSMGDIDFTVSCWAYLDSLPDGFVIHNKGDLSVGNGEEYLLWYPSTATNRLRFQVANSTATGIATANAYGAPATSTWIFAVGWHDSVLNTVNIQVNDGPIDSTAYTGGSYNSAFAFGVGRFINTPGGFLNGRVDALGIWRRILTAAERTRLYNNGNGRQYPNL